MEVGDEGEEVEGGDGIEEEVVGQAVLSVVWVGGAVKADGEL